MMLTSILKTIVLFFFAIAVVAVGPADQSAAQSKQPPTGPIGADAAKFASELADCTRREKALGARGSAQKCNATARSLFNAARQPAKDKYDAYDGSGKFEVIRTGKHVTLFKAKCSDGDLVYKTFVWGITTAQPIRATPSGKAETAFSGLVNFADSGFNIDGGCLIILELAAANPVGVSIGQYDRESDKYAWHMTLKSR